MSAGNDFLKLAEAISFATWAHRNQFRKDGKTPYSAHPVRVMVTAMKVFGVTDIDTLIVAALHDTIEDTTVDFDDIAQRFGAQVATWVGHLTKDSRLPEQEREEVYCRVLADGSAAVKICKLADMHDNMIDNRSLTAEGKAKQKPKMERYLRAIDEGLPDDLRPARDLVKTMIQGL